MGSTASPPKTVLITGASSGIGRETALHLARRGHRVIATSRELARLDDLVAQAGSASLDILPQQLDINHDASVEEAVPGIIDRVGTLDGLVNNAGYILSGCLEDLTIEEVKAQFETNLFAVLRMSQAVLPHMRERGSGTIVNVGSMAGRMGLPGGGAYASSKFAVQGLSRVMRLEVARFGVRVVLIEPGLFRTDLFSSRAVGAKSLDPRSPYHSYAPTISEGSSGSQRWAGDPSRVAQVIGRALESRHPKQRYQVGMDAKLLNLAVRFMPDGFLEMLVKRVAAR